MTFHEDSSVREGGMDIRTITVDLDVQREPVPQPVIHPVVYDQASDVEDEVFSDAIEDFVVNNLGSPDMEPTVFQAHRLGDPVHEF